MACMLYQGLQHATCVYALTWLSWLVRRFCGSQGRGLHVDTVVCMGLCKLSWFGASPASLLLRPVEGFLCSPESLLLCADM